MPIAFSAIAHVAAAGTLLAGSHAREGAKASVTEVEIERLVDVEQPPQPPAPEPEPAVAPPVPAPAAHVEHPHHHHDYPVAPSHDAIPHDPSVHHHDIGLPAPAAPVLTAAEPAPAPMPKFTMSNGPSSETARVVAANGTGTGSAASAESPVYREAEVSSPARLLASVPAAYPAAARAGELEADVAVEILLDTAGNVLEARVVKTAGSGFDESAIAAVRRYRFSPAVRDGHPVRVRMRWSVQFRLR